FYPTILEMAGLPLQPKLHTDGKSLVPLLKNETDHVHDTAFFHYPHRSNQKGSPGSAIREGKYKLILSLKDNRIELYDLESDIGEQKNLSDELPEVRDRLLQQLKTWWREVDARFPKDYTEE
ncbi:MAG: sulfatase/phosphatase domain-containing protein, partial [Rubripirellula sp.]